MRSLAALLLSAVAVSAADDPAGIAFFEQKIRPVLAENCYECHSAKAKKLKGGLYLDSKAGWEKGGDSGQSVIIPGKPDESLLLRTVLHTEPDMEMPPKKPKLPDSVLADLTAWIRMGAPDPRTQATGEAKRADKSWWSLQPLAKEFKHATLDGFIGEKLAANGLGFNPPAAPAALITRMTYDLTGLPPTPEEQDAFVAAHTKDPKAATEALVDRLLASPRYGEQWGRRWLDVVRFGESNGFERNFVIDDLWPFRDYVIRSLNEDKPFDQFIREHLAGDVLGKGRPEVEVGSAFLVAGPYDDVGNQDKVAQKNIRAATVDDMITAASGAFLGLTINCARCHHHKFDPIQTEDYYRLRAAFEGTVHGRRTVVTPEEKRAYDTQMRPLAAARAKALAEQDRLKKEIDAKALELSKSLKPRRPKVDIYGTEERFEAHPARFVRMTMTAQSTSPFSAVGAKLSEVEVWSAEPTPRNVALRSAGGRAEGVKNATARDFPEAYSAVLTIDGDTGAQWFIGNPSVLTLTFAQTETIDRLIFRNAKGTVKDDPTRGSTPCEYFIETSVDGVTWRRVADSDDRQPFTPAHASARFRREATSPETAKALAAVTKELARLDAAIAAIPPLRQMWVGTHVAKPEPTFVHRGGDPMKPAQAVTASSLGVLDQVTKPFVLPADAPEEARRVALADWITRDNPLPPRVLANRIWQGHFGTGIVDTPSDFGFLGSQPTHPELLDFLANRLLAHGWKLKPLHREIMLSRTYLQSSAHRIDGAKADKDARLLWRFPPRRLQAEEIRDTLLAVSGKLRLEPAGGPGFRLYDYYVNNVSTYVPLEKHGPETYRRAVYHQNARASVVDILSDYDLPDIAFAAPKRANTTSPLQSLTLFNHSFTLDMAEALAARLTGKDPIAEAYRLAFRRTPSAKERGGAEQLIAKHGKTAFCRALLNANELIFVE
jgi:mono/diheme cytochrome c family protein